MIDPFQLKECRLGQIVRDYDHSDMILYALSVGFGADPLDSKQRRYVYEGVNGNCLRAFSIMADILAYPSFRVRDASKGIQWKQLVHSEHIVPQRRCQLWGAPSDPTEFASSGTEAKARNLHRATARSARRVREGGTSNHHATVAAEGRRRLWERSRARTTQVASDAGARAGSLPRALHIVSGRASLSAKRSAPGPGRRKASRFREAHPARHGDDGICRPCRTEVYSAVRRCCLCGDALASVWLMDADASCADVRFGAYRQ